MDTGRCHTQRSVDVHARDPKDQVRMKRNETEGEGDAEPDQVVPGAAPQNRNSDAITRRPWAGARGQHIRTVVLEAIRILDEEGYVVGRLADPGLPFDLMAYLDEKIPLFVKAVGGSHPIRDAAGVVRYHRAGIEKIASFWRSDADNFQFWVFSRVAGLLRYRVYRGGIWNEATRKAPERETVRESSPEYTMRSESCSSWLSRRVKVPDSAGA